MYKQRRTLRCGGRPKAVWGAIIGAATSIAGSLLGNAAEKKKQRLANSKEDYNQSLQEAQSMSNALNQSMDYQNNYYDQYRVAARYGRRTLADNGHKIVITDGGDAKRIGNNTFLLRGGSHEDVNETGQTGIGINVGGNEIEAEGGEVAQKKGNSLRIFSAQPMLGGISPAEAVMQGANKDKVFKAQQRFKKNNHLKDDGSKAEWGLLQKLYTAATGKTLGKSNYYKASDGRWHQKRTPMKLNNDGTHREGDFLRKGNDKRRYISQIPLRQVSPEFDLLTGLRGFGFNPTKIGTNTYKSVKNKVGFVNKPNTFTRGIGGREGVQDLVESKVVRGNPIGTEMTAKQFTKATKYGRGKFNEIMNDTGRKGISNRYYNRSLSEDDFNAIQESYNKINNVFVKTNPNYNKSRITFIVSDAPKNPLANYKNYRDYINTITNDKKTLRNATTINPDNGEPIAYFYNDGRNPLTQGHSYAASKWGVRINNPQDYNMKIFDGHLHYSNSKSIPFDSPNLEVFRSTPLGTIRYPKWMLRRGWYKEGGKIKEGNNMIKQRYSLGGNIRGFWNFLRTNRSPIANIAAIATAYQKLNPNSDYNKMKGKYSGGKNFNGAGANITWTNDYKPKKGFNNFNDAYDDAVDHNAETFIFGGKRYNTLRENNPLREINNRAVGIWRDSVVTKDRNGYGKDFGPLKGPATAVPMITETYVPKRRRHLLGGRPKAEDGILKYFNDVQETDAVPTRLFNERRRLTYNNSDYDAGPGTIVDNAEDYINSVLPHSNNPYLEEAGTKRLGKGKVRGVNKGKSNTAPSLNDVMTGKVKLKGKGNTLTISVPVNNNSSFGVRNAPIPTRNININTNSNIRLDNTRHLATTNRRSITNPTNSKGEYKFDFRLPKQNNFSAINWRYRQPVRVPYTKALPGKVQQPRIPGGIVENDAASNAAKKAAEASNDILQSLQKVYKLRHPFARSTPKETYNPNRFNRDYRQARANGQTREEFIRGKYKNAGKAGKYATIAAAGPISAAIVANLIDKDDVNGGNKNNINTQLSPYIARPIEQLNKTSQKKPAANKVVNKPVAKQKTNSLPEVVVTAKKPATKQYKGNVTKGNYQLHDGESKVINGIKYTRSGNTIINHKNNVGYIYDNNGNYTGQADYSKVGKNFNDAFDAARAAGRSNFIYRAAKYNNYSTAKEEDKNKEAINRRVGAKRVAKRLGGYSRPVEMLRCGGSARPKAEGGGLYGPIDWFTVGANKNDSGGIIPWQENNNYGNVKIPYAITDNDKPTKFIPSNKLPSLPNNNGNYKNTTFTTGDYIGLGIDTAAALATGIINYHGAGNYSLPERAGFIQAGKLKTTYNVNPQVAELERDRARMSQDVYRNTSSSVAALNRANILNVNAAQDINKLLAEKENKETELINQDILNRQSVSEKNVANQMAYNNSVAEIKNAANQSRINALNTSLSGLSQAWTNFYTAGRSAFEDNQARIAAIAASEKGSLSRMLLSGYRLDDETLSNLYRNEENADTKRLMLNSMSPRARRRLGII